MRLKPRILTEITGVSLRGVLLGLLAFAAIFGGQEPKLSTISRRLRVRTLRLKGLRSPIRCAWTMGRLLFLRRCSS
jgi:hypothetical protein